MLQETQANLPILPTKSQTWKAQTKQTKKSSSILIIFLLWLTRQGYAFSSIPKGESTWVFFITVRTPETASLVQVQYFITKTVSYINMSFHWIPLISTFHWQKGKISS